MATFFRAAGRIYNHNYNQRPIITICVTNAVLAGISDSLTQTLLAPTPSAKQEARIASSAARTASHDSPSTAAVVASSSARSQEQLQNVPQSGHEQQQLISGHVVMPNDSQTDINNGDQSQKNKSPQQQQLQQDLTQPDPKVPFDEKRLGRFMFWQFSFAPLVYAWYGFLDKRFPMPKVATSTSTAKMFKAVVRPGLKRMMADQALFAPIALGMMFTGLTVLEGGDLEAVKIKLQNTYPQGLAANYTIWPAVQLLNFSIMPIQYRMPFVSAVGILWNAYLSFVNTRGAETVQRVEHIEHLMTQ